MGIESILTHPYKKKIDDMCMQDEAATKIVSWVKNTVDEDLGIPEEKKQSYYLTYGKVCDYKRLQRETVGGMAVAVAGPKTDIINPEDVSIDYGENAVNLKLVEEDAAKHLINTIKTFSNLANALQDRAGKIKQRLDLEGDTMDVKDLTLMEKNLRGYFVEMRNLMKDYNMQTGSADFFKKLGEGLGEQAAKNVLDKPKQEEMKNLITDILKEVEDVDKIPRYLQRLEEILNK